MKTNHEIRPERETPLISLNYREIKSYYLLREPTFEVSICGRMKSTDGKIPRHFAGWMIN